MNSLSHEAELFYRRLMSVVDDFGRFDARPAILRSRLYPLQLSKVRESNVVRWLHECESANLVRLYEINGSQYLTFHKLGEPRAKESKYPDPPEGEKPRLRADANTRAHVRPYSDSYSGPNSDSDANTPPARDGPTKNGIASEADLAQLWCFHCTRRRRGVVQDAATDMAPQFAEMLRLGADAEAIRAAIADPARDRNEHFWEFKARLMPATGPPRAKGRAVIPDGAIVEKLERKQKEREGRKCSSSTTNTGPDATQASSA